MTRDFIAEIKAAQSLVRAHHLFSEMENALSPLELKELMPELHALSAPLRLLMANSDVLRVLERETPERFRSSELFEDARFFSSGTGNKRDKALIIAFGGSSQRVMIPASLFLQMLPADRYDVLLLGDRTNTSFTHGIAGVRTYFAGFMAIIAKAVDVAAYGTLYCYGTSMGGLPALRAGRQLGAKRSIAVGCVFPWQINRLTGSHPAMPAFDPLCVCSAPAKGEFVVAWADGSERDRRSAAHIGKIVPVTMRPYADYRDHNLIYALFQGGRAHQYFAQMFDFTATTTPKTSPTPPWLRLARGLTGQLRQRLRYKASREREARETLDQPPASP